jgi:hypothetical protein
MTLRTPSAEAPLRSSRSAALFAAAALAVMTIVAAGLTGPPAGASPTEPLFPERIDRYSTYEGQQTCSDHVQPGVAAFRSVVLPAYPGTGAGYFLRDCNQGGQSEHKDGRAWDWTIPDGHQADAENCLAWLLSADSYGHDNSVLRRFGIMYIIWNHRIWRAYAHEQGWQPYNGSDPHTTHVHFSFGWDGALEETSWFTRADDGLLLDQAGIGLAWRDEQRADLFRRNNNGEVQQRTAVHDWSKWESIGGKVNSSPAAGWTSQRSLWVVASKGTKSATDAVVVRRWQRGGGWSDWQTRGKVITSGVGVATTEGRLDIFARSATGSVLQRAWSDGTWSPWVDLGGLITAAPAAVWRDTGVLDVFVRGTNGLLYQNTWTGTWSGWVSLGVGITSGAAASSMYPGQVNVFARGSKGNVVESHLVDGEWSAWSDLGAFHVSAPEAAAVTAYGTNVVTRSRDGMVALKTYLVGGGWLGWIPL